jgi:hypothetical protein
MLVYVKCDSGDVEYTVAINPAHVVSITEIRANEWIKNTALITLTTGREHYSKENYLELVSRFASALN